MKGKTKIILTNVETGEQEIHEDNNLITNALDKIINIEMANNNAPNTNILPIATNALGGIMLFDGPLTESVDNIHFPVEAHLVGYADTNPNTRDSHRGSWNSIESGKTGTGYVSVWDFGTTQANGTIKAVARTHVHGGSCPIYNFNSPNLIMTQSGAPETDVGWTPIRYDGEYIYLLKGDTNTHQMRMVKTRIPTLRMGVADFSDVERAFEVVTSWDTTVKSFTYYTSNRRYSYDVTQYADDPRMYEDGQDGYIYCMFNGPNTNLDTDFNSNINYFTIKYSDDSYEKSETVSLTVGVGEYCTNGTYMRYPDRQFGHVIKGVYYKLAANRKIIYKIPLDNPASYSATRIIEEENSDYIDNLSCICSHEGAIYFEVYHYTESSYEHRSGVLYPDGIYVLLDYSYNQYMNHNGSNIYTRCRTSDDDLTVWATWATYPDTRIGRRWAANYLGTINNLASEINKTAAQTMKIIYTLTDIEEDDPDEEPDDDSAEESNEESGDGEGNGG